MGIEPGFQVRIGIYRINPEVDALRREIWEILEPHISEVLSSHYDNSVRHAPFYTRNIESHRRDLMQRSLREIKRLLLEPYDEAWGENCYERAKYESSLGFDMRSRSAMSISVLTHLNGLILSRHRFSAKKAMRLIDAATR